jgi:hypothetical protein
LGLDLFLDSRYFIIMQGFGGKTAHFSQKPQTPTQKMPKAFFVNDPGNRAIIHLL